MSAHTVNPEKLAQLDSIVLDEGAHDDFDSGHCAMEVVSWLADLGFTDAPACASPLVTQYTIVLNDRWDDEKRQALKPYLVRMIGTGGDGKEAARELIAHRWVAEKLLPEWLRLAGMDEQIEALAAVDLSDSDALREALIAIREAARAKWADYRTGIQDRVRKELAKHSATAAVDAAVVADAVAVAAAAAAAVVADTAAVADAAAAGVADTAAVAVVEAAAVAAAEEAAAAGKDWDEIYWTTSGKVRPIIQQKIASDPQWSEVKALADRGQEQALELLDLLIDGKADQCGVVGGAPTGSTER